MFIFRQFSLTRLLAADESLKFWKLFEKKPGSSSAISREGGVTGKGGDMVKQMTIR
jgi:cell division cycle protein 20 (cofactor of APC complex)